jgi:hypothetical protein
MEGYLETDRGSCPFCGEGNEKGSRFCIHCGRSLPGNKKIRSASWYILVGIGLVLAGTVTLFWIRNLESKEVGKVNGERISREEFSRRIDRTKQFYAYRYGQDIFQGEAGRGNLNRLKTETLDEMVNERILLEEAKAKSKIETYERLEPVSTAKASCCSSGGGGCGGSGRAQSLDPKIEQEARAKGLEYYEKKTQKKGASAKVTDFGCHIQVDIIEGGKVVVSLTYNQGKVQEI